MRQQVAKLAWIDEAEALRRVRDRSAAFEDGPSGGDAARRHEMLRRTVESDVVPLLLLSHTAAPDGVTPACAARPSESDVSDLTRLVLAGDDAGPWGFVDAVRRTGVAPESLYLDLLAPVARRLGVMWEEDERDFAEVTIGLVRLHQVMRALSPAFLGDCGARSGAARALLVQAPGEQHGFGLSMVVQFFLRAGWNVCSDRVAGSADLVSLVGDEFFSLVGLSVSSSDRVESLARDIRAIRRASKNRGVRVMVGGPPFIENPQLASLVGADATACDGRQAVRAARRLMPLLATDR